MTDAMATPSAGKDLVKLWGSSKPINYVGLFQPLEMIKGRDVLVKVCRASQGGVNARIIIWEKKKSKTKMHILLFMGVCLCLCLCVCERV